MTTKQISDKMIDPHADTSRVVDRLLRKQLVNKKSDPTDRRLIQVKISPKGKALLADIDQSQPEMDKITQNLSPEKITLLSDLLEELMGDTAK